MERQKLIRKLRLHGIKEEIPNISDENALLLRQLIRVNKTKTMLEIWTANGFSAIQFWIELEKQWWHLTTIEFSKRSHLQAVKNIEEAKLSDTITAIEWNALDVIPKLHEKFDFIFIDGMKRRTLDFFMLCLEKRALWWVIVVDDVIKFKEKMSDFYEYLDNHGIEYSIIPIDKDDGILLFAS